MTSRSSSATERSYSASTVRVIAASRVDRRCAAAGTANSRAASSSAAVRPRRNGSIIGAPGAEWIMLIDHSRADPASRTTVSGELSREIRKEDPGDRLVALVLNVEAAAQGRPAVAVAQQRSCQAVARDQRRAQIRQVAPLRAMGMVVRRAQAKAVSGHASIMPTASSSCRDLM
ncbi:hypothetical protein [Sphingomonas sp. S2M10]|uniref:hypothetical protein n=1 Tax=Sphingomonas sp. S2M10 TaxID=2705010 RepID=UPI001FFCD082|nr:hypothetical protein [Sphingomonas sp. S2M10]